LILRGVIGSLATWAFYLTVQKIGAGRATFIGNTYIVWAALMAAVVLREKLSGPMLAGALVALGGLALMTDLPGSGAHASGYDLMAILNALASAWVVVLVRQMHATEHTATIFGSQCVYGLLLCAAPAVWHFSTPSPASAALIVLAGLAAGAGQLLMTHAYRALSVAEGSLIQALLPIGIALGGAVIFGERFRGAEIVGATLILAGTLVPTLKAGWPRRRSEPYPLAADIRRHCRARDHLGRE
jgi:drug/metabolite transporter (DMT)-like permease